MSTTFQRLVLNKWKFRLYLLKKLPAAFFSGLQVLEYNAAQCVVTVPYKWHNTNPFKSTYFACLAMAAELSTGVPAMGAVQASGKKISMLVADISGKFHKKAVSKTWFTCTAVQSFEQTIAQCIATQTAQTITAKSEGYNDKNELVASFDITWSFKLKN
jgi:hypothetical protein